ncbi:MAG TPA: hypothetical protein V6C72_02265 [Chroococcales cyanobacterium]
MNLPKEIGQARAAEPKAKCAQCRHRAVGEYVYFHPRYPEPGKKNRRICRPCADEYVATGEWIIIFLEENETPAPQGASETSLNQRELIAKENSTKIVEELQAEIRKLSDELKISQSDVRTLETKHRQDLMDKEERIKKLEEEMRLTILRTKNIDLIFAFMDKFKEWRKCVDQELGLRAFGEPSAAVTTTEEVKTAQAQDNDLDAIFANEDAIPF